MIPYKDDNPTESFPFVTIGLIVINTAVYIWEMISPAGIQDIIRFYGVMPFALLGGEGPQPLSPYLTVFSSMFLHGGLFHLGGNMLYLWIFGNNIEDQLGKIRFVLFYLLCGAAAAFVQSASAPYSTIPMVGASGAVSGILGAYLLLYPDARVYTIIFFVFIQIVRLPALIVIGLWAVIQVFNGMLGSASPGSGGVAWFAHLGGFVFGIVLIRLFMAGRRHQKW